MTEEERKKIDREYEQAKNEFFLAMAESRERNYIADLILEGFLRFLAPVLIPVLFILIAYFF